MPEMNLKTKTISSHELLKGSGLPNYKAITYLALNEQIPILLNELNKDLELLEKKLEQQLTSSNCMSWKDVFTPLAKLTERLRWSWSIVSHLNGVCNYPEFREAHAKHQSAVIRFGNRIGQSQIIYKALVFLSNYSDKELNKIEKRILDKELLSMKQLGIALSQEEQTSFNKCSEELANLSTQFNNNVLDATQKWSLLLTKQSEIDGLPIRAKEILAVAANEAGDRQDNGEKPTPDKGPWRLGLDMPRYLSFMTYANNRSLRETLYKAYVKRASFGDDNNQTLIEKILLLRSEQANRLGYKNWAELSLANKMADNTQAVEKLLEELRTAALPAAKNEISELKSYACLKENLKEYEIAPWDIHFWSEHLQQERFDLNQEALRPWFPLNNVLDGLFKLCEKLFDISIHAADGEAPIWHEDVRFFKLHDKDGSHIASFFLDPYSRPKSKRGGAWMDECLIRSKCSDGTITIPVAYLICNQTPPSINTPSLMSFEEVQTLFHEFGHGLQHMLTRINYPQASGINNIEWDAVDL